MIKIIKVKPWMIKFKIDDKVYFIKDTSDDGESIVGCFEFILTDKYGHYTVRHISSKFGLWSVTHYLGKFNTYSQIDLTRFITKLVTEGLMSLDDVDKSYYDPDSLIKEKIAKLEEKIHQHEAEIEKLKAQLK